MSVPANVESTTPAELRGRSRPMPKAIAWVEDSRYEACARAIDIVGASMGLLLMSPVMVAVGITVKLTSKGPIFYRQMRLGLHGQLFPCLKFRTMVADAEQRLARDPALKAEFLKLHKLEEDPRVTPVGQFLRKSSLDELPQLFNVLLGHMTLVGPRPIVPAELLKYGPYAAMLLMVKPGLTGLWQVSGRSQTTYDERVQLDMSYIRSRSVPTDLSLILRTIAVVLRGKGAC
jgi:undecaprenyl-phosphate galactose phosphotransferase